MAYNYSRYMNTRILKNSSGAYTKQFSERNVRFIDHYATAHLKYPSDNVLAELHIENEVWQVGSRFYKLAHKHYGDSGLWWIIPWFNKVPLEASYSAGDIVMIPKPLNYVLSFFE